MVRRSIEGTYAEQYPRFYGWSNMKATVRNITNYDARNIFTGIFLLGARSLELPTLRHDQIDPHFSRYNMMVNGMMVEKHRKKVYLKPDDNRSPELGTIRKDFRGEYRLIPTKAQRSFTIRKDNPLTQIFMKNLEKYSGDEVLYPYSYGQISYRICLVDAVLPQGYSKKGWWHYKGPWWPHRIRAERACQLRRDLHYDRMDLMDWFGWKTAKMADIYAKMVPLELAIEREIEYR